MKTVTDAVDGPVRLSTVYEKVSVPWKPNLGLYRIFAGFDGRGAMGRGRDAGDRSSARRCRRWPGRRSAWRLKVWSQSKSSTAEGGKSSLKIVAVPVPASMVTLTGVLRMT